MSGARTILWLSGRRLVRRGGTVALAAAGIAAGTAVVFGVLGGTTVAQDRAVAQAIERIPVGSRSVRAVWFGVPGQAEESQPTLDRRVRAALAPIGLGRPVSLVLFRESTLAGRFVGLGAVDGLAPFVELESGRLPRRCTAARCEVVRLRGRGAIPNAPGLRLLEVGTATLRSRALFGDFLAPTDNALGRAQVSPSIAQAVRYHRPAPPPLLLAEGVAELASAPALANAYRSYAWVSSLGEGQPRLWQIDSVAWATARARSELQAHSSSFDLVAPTEELREAQQASRAAGRRLLLVGGESAALLFAFAVLAALGLRRDLELSRTRLEWAGARRWQLALAALAETAAVAVAGAVAGYLAGLAASAIAAARAGAPVAAVLAHSVLAPRGVVLAAAVAAAAWAVLFATVSVRPLRVRRAAVSPVDVAAAAAVAFVLFAVARGTADEVRLARDGGSAVGLLLLPGLLTFGAAVLFARLLRPALRLLAIAARGRGSATRLAALSLARDPGRAVVAAAFLVVSFGLALFAEGYRATLDRGEADQAAFAVPVDYTVREDLGRLIPVLDAAPLTRLRALVPGADVVPVLRLMGGVGRLEGDTGITLLGLPPATIERLSGWRDDFSSRSRRELARRIDAPGELTGARLPPGADELRVVAGSSAAVRVDAVVRRRDGRFQRFELGVTPASGTAVLRARLPAAARGGLLVQIVLRPATRLVDRGADAGKAAFGTLRLGSLPGTTSWRGWIGTGGARPRPDGDGLLVPYTLTDQADTVVRPRQPTDVAPPPVLATPRLAAAAGPGGVLPLAVAGERISVRVVGTVLRFPGLGHQGVVGDGDALAAALNIARPGAAEPNELWLALRPGAARAALDRALAQRPYSLLAVQSRSALEAEARSDPIGHGTLLTLVAAALVALALALAGLVLTVLSDLRDERGAFFDLESQGAAPALLRRIVRLRALAVALFGIAAGGLTGLVLGALVTDLVAVTARATSAEPPLLLHFDLRVVALALVAYTGCSVALVGLATRRAFREQA